jgi:hypothetical protein
MSVMMGFLTVLVTAIGTFLGGMITAATAFLAFMIILFS